MVLKLSQCVAWLANLHWRSPLTQLSTRLQLPVLLHILYYLVYTYLPLSCTVVFSLSWPPFFQKLLSCSCCFFYFQRWNSLNLLNVVNDTYIYSCFIGNWWCIYQYFISMKILLNLLLVCIALSTPEIRDLQSKECFWKMLWDFLHFMW